MAGIYLHIPFCSKACNYCNFHFSTNLQNKTKIIDAICKEIELRQNEYTNHIIETIYFGGGTPSLLTIDELQKILSTIKAHFTISENIEFTFEVNPEHINLNKLKELKQIGVNRLSVGIQSFDDEVLKWMNRTHTATQSLQCLQNILDAGFDNFSCDIIYGLPTKFKNNTIQHVQKLIEFGAKHISCYALTVEPKTALDYEIKKQGAIYINTDNQANEFYDLAQFLLNNNFEHYEISNFSVSDFASKHNSNYWNLKPYFGFGPSAHSFDGVGTRSYNIANNAKYLNEIENDILPVEKEILTVQNKINEIIMLQLRLSRGINLLDFKSCFGIDNYNQLMKNLNKFTANEIIKVENNFAFIPQQHRFLSDGIAADLFFI